MKSKQNGLSLISLLIVAAILAFVLLIGFRCVPAITEYMAIQRILPLVADEGDNGAPIADMRRSFDRRAQIDDVSSVKGADLVIVKEAGQVVIEVDYARTVPVAGNVSLLFDFHVSNVKR
ncbi:DUF4845 domain-containing protein [Pseudothauera rhizosphaerae]|nr:DUF4845 domain-containing protein [Pseudothauera rhizosphaerae]